MIILLKMTKITIPQDWSKTQNFHTGWEQIQIVSYKQEDYVFQKCNL